MGMFFAFFGLPKPYLSEDAFSASLGIYDRMQIMITKKTSSIDTNIYLAAAEKLGYQTSVLNAESSFALISSDKQMLYIYENFLSINDQVSGFFSKNKYLAAAMLSQQVPDLIPRTLQVKRDEDNGVQKAINFARDLDFSVVIKPNNASLGIGVHLLPKDDHEVDQILSSLLKEYESVLVQEYLSAKKEYRIVYVNGTFFDAVQRIPAYVIGDGTHTIQELIDQKNTQRQKHDFPLLEVDAPLEAVLSELSLTLESVPQVNQRLTLRKVCTFAQGGETERVNQQHIHPDFLATFEKVVKASRLRFIGIDLMCENIQLSPNEQSAGINEINSAPMADLHYFADLQQAQELESTQRLLRMILEG